MSGRTYKAGLKTVVVACVGVIVFVLLVFYGTGRWSTKPAAPAPRAAPQGQWYRAIVRVHTTDIPFLLRLPKEGGEGEGMIVNGREDLPVSVQSNESGRRLDFPHYGAWIELTEAENGALQGTWNIQPLSGEQGSHSFRARPIPEPLPEFRFRSTQTGGAVTSDFSHVWRLDIEQSGVGRAIFRQSESGFVSGSIEWATGDLQSLSGLAKGRKLRLSHFDGGHGTYVELEHAADSDQFTGRVESTHFGAFSLQGKRADEITLESSTMTPDIEAIVGHVRSQDPGEEPGTEAGMVLALLNLDSPASHGLMPLLKNLAETEATPFVIRVTPPAEANENVSRRIAAFQTHHGLDWDVQALPLAWVAPLADARGRYPTLPALVFLAPGGSIVGHQLGFHSTAATHSHAKLRRSIEAQLEAIVQAPSTESTER